MLTRGVKGLTIAEIAEKFARRQGRTAYLYWKTKEDLLLAVITTTQIFDRAAHDPERSTSSARSSHRTPACSSPTTRSR